MSHLCILYLLSFQVVKSNPHDLFIVLERLYSYIGHSNWQTRIAAVQVILFFHPILSFLFLIFFLPLFHFDPFHSTYILSSPHHILFYLFLSHIKKWETEWKKKEEVKKNYIDTVNFHLFFFRLLRTS